MEKIININLAGRPIPIEDTAYLSLKEYLSQLSSNFNREEGGEEVVNDIESRMAELFQEKLEKGNSCITQAHVAETIEIIGNPEDLMEEADFDSNQKRGDQDAQQNFSNTRQKLYRDVVDKKIGGVCSGIAHYFNIDPTVVRVIALFLLVAYGFGLLLYLAMWLVVPAGKPASKATTERKLYRDTEHKVIGGVAMGLAHYLKIDPIIPRLIFILPLIALLLNGIFSWGWWSGPANVFLSFTILFPTLILTYLVLWIMVPKAPLDRGKKPGNYPPYQDADEVKKKNTRP